MSTPPVLRLSDFIRSRMELILQAWEQFAKTIEPPALSMDSKALRNHASLMLRTIAEDLERGQTEAEGIRKSEGRGPRPDTDTAAETHAIARLLSGFDVQQLASEYRALRASVLRLWAKEWKEGNETNVDDITRFNEAIDQALAESLARYTLLLEQSRNLFLAILGHDLRNPLGASIQGAQILLLAEDIGDQHRRIAARIYNSSHRMSKLVSDLLDYTRSHLGRGLPLDIRPANFGEIARRVIDEIGSAHPDRDIVLQSTGPLEGRWDQGRVAQAMSNLLGNAVQHGLPGAPIGVSIDATGSEVVLAINNQGPVIPEEKLQAIFEPLVRLVADRDSASHQTGSMGLGLYIVREVAIAHGGSAQVSSSAAQGTTFTLRLPRGTA
ncbi:MAG TPA: HAMP domain-containing sensor histidine kinase [Herbaspirillum sp.]|uniref:sensor histidine kinase n=1 Tax=Herbaspirillum sp. TaxID=1890675 RepID=UPI002D5ECB67|nr:HAMP domain-containing sensor histidine kinase [Herbaspirillum sp.]HZG18588.1 HAMP domain-containing sensor histidine kinase [Herbaspirillum sp.]